MHRFRASQTISALKAPIAPLKLVRSFSSYSFLLCMAKPDDLYQYTSGKWLWNNELRLVERKTDFNALELKSLAAAAVNRSATDITNFEKLAEGGFNRTFLLSMRDGFQMVARIPYPITEPKDLLIASEVATMDYLRARDIPAPAVYGYSTDANNPARTEYIFMEVMRGTNLGDIWYDLGEKARIKMVERLVELESRLFSLDFPASGSLFYTRDLDPKWNSVRMPSEGRSDKGGFSIGPELALSLWYGRRRNLSAFRGPYRGVQEALAAGAQKEIRYLDEYGQPLHPFQRLRRESCDFQRQSHSEHSKLLKDYLLIVPHVVPQGGATFTRPKLRHPDLQPNNIFVSDDLEITGLIDWQNATILPLFLQGGIPASLQNHGDDVSESLEFPILPPNFERMDESAQFREVHLFRRRQLHYYYVKKTMAFGVIHSEVLTDPLCVLCRKLFSHARDPWEGDNVTLKADLVDFTRAWSLFVQSKPGQSIPTCPIHFSEEEQQECYKRVTAAQEADLQFRTCLDLVGVGPEGWVPVELYDSAQLRAQQLMDDTLAHAESDEERDQIQEHWIFNDFDEDAYY